MEISRLIKYYIYFRPVISRSHSILECWSFASFYKYSNSDDIICDVIKKYKNIFINAIQQNQPHLSKKPQMNDYEYLFKFIMIGDSNVGKSCILMRLLQGRFKNEHEPTLGVQFGSKIVPINKTPIKLQIWDTAGQQSFKSITRAYYKGSIAALLVYDISNQTSFNNLHVWINDLRNHSHQKMNIALVGNKCDLESSRVISKQMAEQFAKKYDIQHFYQVSALNGNNIQKCYLQMASRILAKIQKNQLNIDLDSTYGIKRGKKAKSKFPTSTISISKQQQKAKKNETCQC